MSTENWAAALDKGDLASVIFEEELLAVQELMNGPVSGIVQASEHLYRGTDGFPRDMEVAKKILYDTARDGAPEAQFSFAIALLDRRFSILGQERQYQLIQAERYLMMAVNQNHLPAIHKLAEICENTTNWHNDVAAYALYRMAAREGATGFEKHLERLRARNQLYLDSELERIERWINDGIGPACY